MFIGGCGKEATYLRKEKKHIDEKSKGKKKGMAIMKKVVGKHKRHQKPSSSSSSSSPSHCNVVPA